METIITFFQEGLTRSIRERQEALYTAASLLTLENDINVQEPDDCLWDPAEFWLGQTVTRYTRHRILEMKHGRVAMLAITGYATPRITQVFPRHILTSRVYRAIAACSAASRTLASVARLLAATVKVRVLGCGRFYAYSVFCELSTAPDSGMSAKRRRLTA